MVRRSSSLLASAGSWLLAASMAACAYEPPGSVALRVFSAAGPDPLSDVVNLRLGLVGGASTVVPADGAFDLDAIGLNAETGTRQVSLEGLLADGSVAARAISAPADLGAQDGAVVDLVLRRAEAFSAALSPADVGATNPGVAVGPGGAVSLLGPSGLDTLDPWLVGTRRVALDDAVVALAGALDGAMPLPLGETIVAVGPAGCVAFEPEGSLWSVATAQPACRGTEQLRKDAGWLPVPGSPVPRWWVLGGTAQGGASAGCSLVTLTAEAVEVTACPDLATPRVRPLVVAAGERVLIVGGAPGGSWGESRFAATPEAGVETLITGPTRPPSDGATYGADSAVFVGDGTASVYAVVAGQLGTAGTTGRTRAGGAVGVLPDGRLLVAGGRSDDSAVSADILRMNSGGTFEFEAEVPILVPRADARFVPSATGPLLVGGVVYGSTDPVPIVEVFVPR